MKDVFEPALSMNKTNVFEPTLSFSGDKSQKSGKGKDIAIDIGGKLLGSLLGGGSKKSEIQAQLSASGSKENADMLSCDTIKVGGFQSIFGDWSVAKQNRVRDCREKVRTRYENERKELRRQLEEQTKLERERIALQKASLESNERISLQTQPKSPQPEKKSNKGLIIGLSVGGGVLVLATVLILVLRKKK